MLHPSKWNLLCWILLLLWLLPSIGGNIPFTPKFIEPDSLQKIDRAVVYDRYQSALIGFPFVYSEIHLAPDSLKANRFDHPSYLILNLTLVPLTLFSIVYSIQSLFPRFSVLTFLGLVALIAILFLIGKLALSSGNYNIQKGFVLCVYFAPLVAAAYAFLHSRIKSSSSLA